MIVFEKNSATSTNCNLSVDTVNSTNPNAGVDTVNSTNCNLSGDTVNSTNPNAGDSTGISTNPNDLERYFLTFLYTSCGKACFLTLEKCLFNPFYCPPLKGLKGKGRFNATSTFKKRAHIPHHTICISFIIRKELYHV